MPKLFARSLFALVVLGLTPACKNKPPIFEDIGKSMDQAASRMKSAVDGAVEGIRGMPEEAEEAENEDPSVKEARERFEEGKVAYQTARYIDAVDKFQASFEASAKIKDAELKAQVQSSLYYNLGQAQLKAYDLDQDRTRLAQSKALLQNHLDSDPSLSDAERDAAQAIIDEAQARLDALDAGEASGGESGEESGESGVADTPSSESSE